MDRRRLRAIADDAHERLASLEQRLDAAQEQGFPGPHWQVVEAARAEWQAADDAAALAETDEAIRRVTEAIDLEASRSSIHTGELTGLAERLGSAIAERFVRQFHKGQDFNAAVERAGAALDGPIDLILADVPFDRAVQAREEIRSIAKAAFMARAVELSPNWSGGGAG